MTNILIEKYIFLRFIKDVYYFLVRYTILPYPIYLANILSVCKEVLLAVFAEADGIIMINSSDMHID